MKRCHNCNLLFDDAYNMCTQCGSPLVPEHYAVKQETKPEYNKVLMHVANILNAILIGFTFFMMLGGGLLYFDEDTLFAIVLIVYSISVTSFVLGLISKHKLTQYFGIALFTFYTLLLIIILYEM